MIIISNKPGQLANLIVVYANFIALGLEKKIRIINPAFHSGVNYFQQKKHFLQRSFFYSLVNFFARGWNKLKLNSRLLYSYSIDTQTKINLDSELPDAFRSRLCFVQGWLYRANNLLLKHKSEVKEFFRPTAEHLVKIDSFFSQEEFDSKIIIGVHVRRGDYENFEGGRYFYDYSRYAEIIERVGGLFETKDVIFLVCSNEQEISKKLGECNYKIMFGPGHELQDLYCFSRCNFLVGPPSTYTMWASFYGNVPLLMLHEPDKQFTLEDFKIVESF
jgi:hypothetical protein